MKNDLTFREDIDRRSIANVRNTLAVTGNVTMDQAVRNDLTVLWTPSSNDDVLTLPTTGLIGTYLTIVNQSDTYGGNIANNATLWPVEAGQGMLFILAGDLWLPAANADIVESTLATKATYVYVDGELEYRPTYTEIIDGFTDATSGGTTVPTIPTIATCRGLFRGVQLSWDRQLNLTNFDHYEVQVSSDGASWYSLQFDGTDWKDTLNAGTEWENEFLVHPNIPLIGDADNPSGQTLYYRVRRVTKEPVSSSWSSNASTTTTTVQAGDLAQNSIYANNLIASEVITMLLRAAQLWVGYTGSVDSNGDPILVEGERRIYQDGDEIKFQERTDEAWTSVNSIRIGGVDSNGLFRAFMNCRGVANPLADDINQEFLPEGTIAYRNYDGDYNDQNGVSAGHIDTTINTTTKKFGSGSVWGELGKFNAFVRESTDFLWTESIVMSGWFYINNLHIESSITSYAGPVASFMDPTVEIRELRTTVGEAYNILGIWVSEDYIRLGYIAGEDDEVGAVATWVQEISHTFNDEWIYLGVYYDPDNSEATLVVNENSYTSSFSASTWITGWTSDRATYFNPMYNTTYGTIAFDDTLHALNTEVNVDFLIQHYTHNQPWNPDYSAKDLILLPADGGYVNLSNSPTKYYAPVSGEPSVGTLHFRENTTEHTTPDISDSSVPTGAWEEWDVGAAGIVPTGTKAILCHVSVVAIASQEQMLLMVKASSDTATGTNYTYRTIRLEAERNIDGNIRFGGNCIFSLGTTEKIEYRAYSASYSMTSLDLIIKGYYI